MVNFRSGAGFAAALLAAGCSIPQEQPPRPPQTDVAGLLQRVEVLEQRVRRLEMRTPPAARTLPAVPPYAPAKKQIVVDEGALQELRERRRQLLEKYTASHPDVLLLDEEIQALESGRPRHEPLLRDLPLRPPSL